MSVLPVICSHLLHRYEINYGGIHRIVFSLLENKLKEATCRKQELTTLWRRYLGWGLVFTYQWPGHKIVVSAFWKIKIPGRYIFLYVCSHLTTLRWVELSINSTWKTKLILKYTKHLHWEQTRRLNIDFSRSLSFSFCSPSTSSLTDQNLFVLKGRWFVYTPGQGRRKREKGVTDVLIMLSSPYLHGKETLYGVPYNHNFTLGYIWPQPSTHYHVRTRTLKYTTPVLHIKYKLT